MAIHSIAVWKTASTDVSAWTAKPTISTEQKELFAKAKAAFKAKRAKGKSKRRICGMRGVHFAFTDRIERAGFLRCPMR
jgi:hypothetical protein